MKLPGVLFCFAFGMCVLALPAEETPSVEFFTGWGWMPYPYYGHPYRYGYAPYGWEPCIGIAHPLNGFYRPYDPYFYGDPYGPYWGYGYGVRYNLRPDRHFPHRPDQDLAPLPGSAPTELRASEHKTAWDQNVEAFLKTHDQPVSTATNAPPSRTVSPQ